MTDKEIVKYVEKCQTEEEVRVNGVLFLSSDLFDGYTAALMLKKVDNEVEWFKKNYLDKMHNLKNPVQHEGFKEYILDEKVSFIVVD